MRPAITRDDLVRNRMVLQGNWYHAVLGDFPALADGVGHFPALAQTDADPAPFIAHDDQGAKAEAASALDHFGGAIDKHDFLRERITPRAARIAVGGTTATRAATTKPATAEPATTTTTSAAASAWTTAGACGSEADGRGFDRVGCSFFGNFSHSYFS